MTTAVADIQGRISEIESRIATVTGQRGVAGSSSAGGFGDVLSQVLGSSNTTSFEPSSFTTSGFGVTGSAVVADAKKYLGIPYVWGGTDPAKGLDCSGLVQLVYKDLGISLPRTAAQQAQQGTKVNSIAEAKPGDLVAFGSPVDHIGIYAGDNKMIVAPKRGDVVKIQEIYTTPTAIRRIVPESGTAAGSSSMQATLASLQSTLSSGSSGNFGKLSSQYNALFTAAGNKHGIDPLLLAAVAKQESGFNPSARSSAGAQGLMQIMPGTAKGLGVNALNPTEAVDGAAKMLAGLIDKFGSTSLALAAYNAGPGAVSKYNGIPPYKETQNYVKKVLALHAGAS